MLSKKLVLSVIGAMIVLGSTAVVAREASEGPRGADRVHTGTHKNSVDVDSFIVAREAAEGPRGADNERPGDRQRRGGRVSEDAGEYILAREASEGPRGADRVHTGTHKNSADTSMILAREAGEGPRGEGKGHPNGVDVTESIIA
jgi:hypothetical protein